MTSKRNRPASSSSEFSIPLSPPLYKKSKPSKTVRFSIIETASTRDAGQAVEQLIEDSDQDLRDFSIDLFAAPPSPQQSTEVISRDEENASNSESDLSSVPSSPLQSVGEKEQSVNSRRRKNNDHNCTHTGKHQRNLKPFGDWTDQEKEDLLSARTLNVSFAKCGFQLNRHRIDCKQQYNFLLEKIRKGEYHQSKE